MSKLTFELKEPITFLIEFVYSLHKITLKKEITLKIYSVWAKKKSFLYINLIKLYCWFDVLLIHMLLKQSWYQFQRV